MTKNLEEWPEKLHVLFVGGGLDSAYLRFLKQDIIEEYVHFNYGQPCVDQEKDAVNTWGIDSKIISWLVIPPIACGTFYYARNLKFMLALKDRYPLSEIVLYMGCTADDVAFDSQPSYVQNAAALVQASYEGAFRVVTPLIDMTKKEIVLSLVDLLADLEIDHEGVKLWWCNCPLPDNSACGECISCHLARTQGIGNWG
jgi:7-cyano-7-deazaguanine synthase in queuosine biosynthesis